MSWGGRSWRGSITRAPIFRRTPVFLGFSVILIRYKFVIIASVVLELMGELGDIQDRELAPVLPHCLALRLDARGDDRHRQRDRPAVVVEISTQRNLQATLSLSGDVSQFPDICYRELPTKDHIWRDSSCD